MKAMRHTHRLAAILFFLLAVVAESQSQSISVSRFRLLENDLTALNHETQRLDQNGELCAVIKVVTPVDGFNFDGGSIGIVANVPHAGECWLYVPHHSLKLTISHRNFLVLRDYYYDVPIESGRTYEMLIDINTGAFTNIVAQLDKSDIFIDGEYVGKSPVYNRYLNYGQHTLRAVKGMFEGEKTLQVSRNDNLQLVEVPMQDQSSRYGDVTVSVEGGADLLVDGKLVGNGQWKTQLKEGSYNVVARKANCEDALTTFTVKAQQANDVKATAPRPYVGYLSLYTRPRNVSAILDGRESVDLTQQLTLPIGTHQLQLSRKGYVSQDVEYDIRNEKTVFDTLQLKRFSHFKPFLFYFGAGYTLRHLSGLTATAGITYLHHDVQASYTFGLGKSGQWSWYDKEGTFVSSQTCKMSSIELHYGYQIELMRNLAIAPQVGYQLNILSGSLVEGSNDYANGTKSNNLTFGAKIILVPLRNLFVFAQPQYSVALSSDPLFTESAKCGGFDANHFSATIGLLANF
jgi:hypothetical protein